MGTKQALAPLVREAVDDLSQTGTVADLFSGLGSVATSLAPAHPVITNDVLAFTGAFHRARLTNEERPRLGDVVGPLRDLFVEHRAHLQELYGRRLRKEALAIERGAEALSSLIDTAPHAAKSTTWKRLARTASGASGSDRYCLATLYFSAGYFSTGQAIALDSIRYAIDEVAKDRGRSWMLGAWLAAAATTINAPGHSAQYLRPNSREGFARVIRQWSRDPWSLFVEQLLELKPVGTVEWREQNRVLTSEACAVARSEALDDCEVVYADPPYTKDHYSRFYHVYETLYLYDFPASSGVGRYRSNRFSSPFSLATQVVTSFQRLFTIVAGRRLKLVLSYPKDGLLQTRGVQMRSLLKPHFSSVRSRTVQLDHSTMGASKGAATKATSEVIYVCVP
jgi:adenine-specific DNA-methyltransferase